MGYEEQGCWANCMRN